MTTVNVQKINYGSSNAKVYWGGIFAKYQACNAMKTGFFHIQDQQHFLFLI